MSVRNDHTARPRQGGKATESRRAYLAQRRDWEHRRSVWLVTLEQTKRGGSLTDSNGVRWDLIAGPWNAETDRHGRVVETMPRVWSPEHGGDPMLSEQLAGVLAWQDVHVLAWQDVQAGRHGAIGRAARNAGAALRWTILGLWRTPAVRVTGLVIGAAIVAGGVVLAGTSVAP